MKCTKCGRIARQGMEQVGVKRNGTPIYHHFLYCDNCRIKWDCEKKKDSVLSIVSCALVGTAIIFPMIPIIGFLLLISGFIVSIVDLCIHDKEKKHTGSWLATIASALVTIILYL